jgi:hypothetical protein
LNVITIAPDLEILTTRFWGCCDNQTCILHHTSAICASFCAVITILIQTLMGYCWITVNILK